MILYENTVENFEISMKSRNLISFLVDEYFSRTSRKVSPANKVEWKYALEVLNQLLDKAEISLECGVRIDYVMLDTNNRFEIIITGENNYEPIVHIIEMLPWEKVRDTNELDIVSYDSYERSGIVSVHPSYQSVSYKKFFSKSQKELNILSFVYLFECNRDSESEKIIENYEALTNEAPIFFAEESALLFQKLSVLKKSNNGIKILNLFHDRDQLSSEGIDAFLSGILSDEEMAIFTEEQKLVMASIIKRSDEGRSSVVELKGSCGTGKTMLAISCLVELGNRKKKVAYVSYNKTQCEILRDKINKKIDYDYDIDTISRFAKKQLLSYKKYDVIFIDESQMLFSELEYTPNNSSVLNTIFESSDIVVFLYNKDEIIGISDINGDKQLQRYAEIRKREYIEYNLNKNIRYSGRGSGVNWLAHQFQIMDTGNFEDWDKDSFRIEIVDTPQELLKCIKHNSCNSNPSRVLVSYREQSELEYDEKTNDLNYTIRDYNFKIPVCTFDDERLRDWYNNDELVDYAVGPKETRGLEFNYVGVIIGKELSYDKDSGKLIINSNKILSEKVISDIQIIKMSYFVLLSRGKNGVYLFIEDSLLKEAITERLNYASRRFSWIKELADKYKLNSENDIIDVQNDYNSYSCSFRIYKAINEFVANFKKVSKDELDSEIYKELLNQCSELLLELQAEALNQTEIKEKYKNKIIKNMGEAAWDKLSDLGKKCLVSAELTYYDMKDYNQLYDFSSVCVQVSKAVEYELTKRFFMKYVDYLEVIYKKSNDTKYFLSKIPSVLKYKDKKNECLLSFEKVTLGKLEYIVGIREDGTIINEDSYNSFNKYAKDVLLKKNLDAYVTLKKHIKFITRIKDDYRNNAAHKKTMDVVTAKQCLNYVIEVERTLGQMLDDYIE